MIGVPVLGALALPDLRRTYLHACKYCRFGNRLVSNRLSAEGSASGRYGWSSWLLALGRALPMCSVADWIPSGVAAAASVEELGATPTL